MAQFTESLCREVIRTKGQCGLTRNEIVQLAVIALRTLEREPKGVMPTANDDSPTAAHDEAKDNANSR